MVLLGKSRAGQWRKPAALCCVTLAGLLIGCEICRIPMQPVSPAPLSQNNPAAGPPPPEVFPKQDRYQFHVEHWTNGLESGGNPIRFQPAPPPLPPMPTEIAQNISPYKTLRAEIVVASVIPRTNMPMNHLTFSNVWGQPKPGIALVPFVPLWPIRLQASTNPGAWFAVTNFSQTSAAVSVLRSNFPSGTRFRSVADEPF